MSNREQHGSRKSIAGTQRPKVTSQNYLMDIKLYKNNIKSNKILAKVELQAKEQMLTIHLQYKICYISFLEPDTWFSLVLFETHSSQKCICKVNYIENPYEYRRLVESCGIIE